MCSTKEEIEPPLMLLISAVYKFVRTVKVFAAFSGLLDEGSIAISKSGNGSSSAFVWVVTIRVSVSGAGG